MREARELREEKGARAERKLGAANPKHPPVSGFDEPKAGIFYYLESILNYPFQQTFKTISER